MLSLPNRATFATLLLPLLFAATHAKAEAPRLDPAKRQVFLFETEKKYGIESEQASAWLEQAKYQQSIIDAITRPAESKPWATYRPIFMTADRIAKGRAFADEYREELAAAEAKTGVPANIITAILGVETFYGGNTGKYRVLDALYTLGFFYPARETFFRGELAQMMALAKEENLDLSKVSGSYAGAMGWGQFMPSSYRAYAVDGDGDGTRDLWNNLSDVIHSVANYFTVHKWKPGEPVAVPAIRDADAVDFKPDSLEAKYSLAELASKGYRPKEAIGHSLPATLVTLQGANGPEYWITFQNFYVISRYNRSPLYSMAVYQLSQAIAGSDEAYAAP
jgi:membrane-bound lytic murein transglycosylase B